MPGQGAGGGGGGGGGGPSSWAGLALVPLASIGMLLLVLGAGGAQASPHSAACGGAGTAQAIGDVRLDAEQMGNAQTIVTVVAGRRLPVYAAVVALTTAYTESALHNSTVQTDHDSEGLFQQRISIYTAAVAADPARATGAFLDRLVAVPGWPANPVGVDAQDVQASAFPGRYQPNAPLAAALAGQLWPAADSAATDTPASVTSPASTPGAAVNPDAPVVPTGAVSAVPVGAVVPAICAGAGGAIEGGGTVAGQFAGPHGDNVAGSTTIPAGFTESGSAAGRGAVGYALAQLGKPYLWGGVGPAAFDCSGLTMAAWASQGVALPHLAAAQATAGSPEPADLSQAVSGDLVLIPGADGTPANPGHVGMVAGYTDGPAGRHLYLVQAPMTGLPVELTEATEWSGQIVAVRHLR